MHCRFCLSHKIKFKSKFYYSRLDLIDILDKHVASRSQRRLKSGKIMPKRVLKNISIIKKIQ